MYILSTTLGPYALACAVVVHGAFAGYLARAARTGQVRGRLPALFFVAIVVTAGWAAVALYDTYVRSTWPAYLAAGLDLLRYVLWLLFLLGLLRPALRQSNRSAYRALAGCVAVVAVVSAAALAYRVGSGAYEADAQRWLVGLALAPPLLGLVLVEQLFRNLDEDSRWNAKPLCIGLAVIFAFDVYLYAEGTLLGRLDPDALAVRGAAHLLAVPLLLAASQRHKDWINRLHVSRSVAFYSATLLLAGGYLLFLSAVGSYVRYFGGDWGRGLELGVLTAGLTFLALLLLSGSWRARVKVWVAKSFFSYRFDYREEWLRFTAMLSNSASPTEVGASVVRGLANMVESPGGALWMRDDSAGPYRQALRWNFTEQTGRESADSSLCGFLREKAWVVDVCEYRRLPRLYGEIALPNWALTAADLWLIVPLLVGEELLGFVTLARPRAEIAVNWEARDLLKTASRQAAGFLAQMHATEALLEARKFEAFNRMSAFVVHDLKNIVTQLSLMMKNAQRLHANPEFQRDMLLTIDNALEKMRRLLLQLREGATPPGGANGVELAPLLRRLAKSAGTVGRVVEVECAEGLATRGLEERLERVLGHLVDNALDATAPAGRVWIKGFRQSGQVMVEIGDDGVGMSEEFMQGKLFRPFSSTKPRGMGIGLYESSQYIRELGGAIKVDSHPGRGSVFSVSMPAFEVGTGSDLHQSVPQ